MRTGEEALVLDNGTGYTKVGIAGEEAPSVIEPTIVGQPKIRNILGDIKGSTYFCGEEAIKRSSVLYLRYPVENGIIIYWKDIEEYWGNLFQKLGTNPGGRSLVLSETPFNPEVQREETLDLLFEKFSLGSVYLSIAPLLSLYGVGKSTGSVLDIGEGISCGVSIYDGYPLPNTLFRQNIGGRDVNEHLLNILLEQGYCFPTMAEKEACRLFKERFGYVAGDYEGELGGGGEKVGGETQELPDGQKIALGNERFRAPEVLFQPGLMGRDLNGVHQSLFNSISRADIHTRQELFKNIVVTGGSTLFPGFLSRLNAELSVLGVLNGTPTFNFLAPGNRHFLPWVGGSVLGSLNTLRGISISREEYKEYGIKICDAKFPKF